MVLRHREDRRAVFLLPGGDQPGFGLAAQHHEGRRADQVNQIALLLGQQRDLRFVARNDTLELGGGAFADVEKQRNDTDAFRQQADELLGRPRPHRRIDQAYDAVPAGERHIHCSLLIVAGADYGQGLEAPLA